ncbi:MAG TPA: TonB-dependent receptor [Gemmatirosa sp.]
MRAFPARFTVRVTAWHVGSALAVAPAIAAAQVATGTVSGRVTSTDGEPVAGATVGVTGTAAGAITRGDGTYRITLRPGTYELRARLIGYAAARDSVVIAAGASATRNFRLARSASALQGVAVLGSRAQPRSVVESPVPVDVLSAADIRATGRTETAEVIQALAPSFNFPRPSVTDGTDQERPATLRGLNPDQLLVLVDGKRRHTSALVNVNGSVGRGSTGVDLNAIPVSMIDHIEVLREGAAAQYGSDAIAGVINIVLKGNQPGTLTAEGGGYSAGDGGLANVALDGGQSATPHRFIHGDLEFRDQGRTNRAGLDPRQQYFAGDPRNTTDVPRADSWYGDPRQRAAQGAFNGEYALGDSGVTLYSFGTLTNRRGESPGFFRRPLDDRTVRAIYPDGFLPVIRGKIWDGSAVVGGRGTLGGFAVDLSQSYSTNAFNFNVANSANVTYGASSPTTFNAGTLQFQQGSTNLDLTRTLRLPNTTPVRLAGGAEFRAENYRIAPGERASYTNGGVPILDGPDSGKVGAIGSQVFPGYQPSDRTDASRTSEALYVDLESDLTRQFLLGVAGRFEHYSDFGSTTNGLVRARYAPVQGFALRGSAGTGFRAPSLAQSFYSQTQTVLTNGTLLETRTFPVSSPEARALGATTLTPERSVNFGVGTTLEPVRNLGFTVDAYQIRIRDRIVLSNTFTGASVRAALAAAGFNNISGAQFFTNAVGTRTRGIDAVGNYGITYGGGLARFTAGYSRNETRVVDVIPTPAVLAGQSETLFGRVERARLENAQPRSNLLLSGSYDRGPLGVVLRTQRFGAVTSTNSPGYESLDQTFGAKWVSDVSASYRVAARATLTVGSDNVFNVYPDRYNNNGNVTAGNSGNSFYGLLPYSTFSPFGFNGRFVYGRVTLGL